MEEQMQEGQGSVHPAVNGSPRALRAAPLSGVQESQGSATPAMQECEHRYLTAFHGTGWICARCRVPVLSLSMPISLPLIVRAIEAVIGRAAIARATGASND